HRSLTQMYASSGAVQAAHVAGSSPSRGGSTSTGGSSRLVRSWPSNGKLGQLTNSGSEPMGEAEGLERSDTRETLVGSATPVATDFPQTSAGAFGVTAHVAFHVKHRRYAQPKTPRSPAVIHRPTVDRRQSTVTECRGDRTAITPM